MKREAKRGPLTVHRIKILKVIAEHGIREAQELLETVLGEQSKSQQENNLPAALSVARKSFKSVRRQVATPLKLE